MAYMAKMGSIKYCTCTAEEILRVRDHQQHCFCCLIAKAKALTTVSPSGIRPNIIGRSWSMDYQGPYAVPAIGGYTGRFLFVERSRGYLMTFLVHAKSEALACVRQVNKHCRVHGHLMQELQVDKGSVENSIEFIEQCGLINVDRELPGIIVHPVVVNMQKQNIVERHVQTFDNNYAAIMVDNDLLPPSFWGLGIHATADAMNAVTNSLCEDGHPPNYYFEGRSTDLAYQFRVGFGKPVICTRVAKPKGPKMPGMCRNEFGICVGPGQSRNGAVWVYLPSRGTMALSLRYNVRKIRLGSKKQMTIEEGKQYMPTLGEDGLWHLVTRGDSGILGKQFALAYNEDLSTTVDYSRAEISTTTLDSSISLHKVILWGIYPKRKLRYRPSCLQNYIWIMSQESYVMKVGYQSRFQSMMHHLRKYLLM
jgi:hypothetical protein